jgi:hypothetical protein
MDNGDYHVVDKGDWFKIHHTGWLEGSLRYNKDYDGDKLAAFRGVMTDICALISRSRFRDGTLRYAVGKPMQRDYIAKVLNISLGLLNGFIDLGLKDTNNDNDHTRIEIWEDGTIEVVNWQRHQAVKPKKQNTSNKYNSFPREPISKMPKIKRRLLCSL